MLLLQNARHSRIKKKGCFQEIPGLFLLTKNSILQIYRQNTFHNNVYYKKAHLLKLFLGNSQDLLETFMENLFLDIEFYSYLSLLMQLILDLVPVLRI